MAFHDGHIFQPSHQIASISRQIRQGLNSHILNEFCQTEEGRCEHVHRRARFRRDDFDDDVHDGPERDGRGWSEQSTKKFQGEESSLLVQRSFFIQSLALSDARQRLNQLHQTGLVFGENEEIRLVL